MTKEKLIELLNNPKSEVKELSTNKSYIIKVEVGDMPKEQAIKMLTHLRERLLDMGIKNVLLVSSHNGIPDLDFIEVKEELANE